MDCFGWVDIARPVIWRVNEDYRGRPTQSQQLPFRHKSGVGWFGIDVKTLADNMEADHQMSLLGFHNMCNKAYT